jgi:hypothetical protein
MANFRYSNTMRGVPMQAITTELPFESAPLLEESEPEPWFTSDAEGQIQFTPEGIRTLRAHFGRAGIDIRTISNEAQFHEAWNRASPYLNDTLLAIAKNGTWTLERQLLVAVMKGDTALADTLKARLERRQRLGLRSV